MTSELRVESQSTSEGARHRPYTGTPRNRRDRSGFDCTGLARNQSLQPVAQKHGYSAKYVAGALLAVKSFGCKATVAVADRDGETQPRPTWRTAPSWPSNCSRSIRRFGGWQSTRSKRGRWACRTRLPRNWVWMSHSCKMSIPRGVDVESLSERSGKRERHPKQLLERIAQLKHRNDSTEFREAVAERTDPAGLAQACAQGFAPFAERLRRAFGAS